MLPSRRLASAPSRALVFAMPLVLSAVLLAGVLAVAAAGGTVAHADAQPTLTVSVKSGADTQTTYTIVAANFPANSTLTETFGDGSNIPPTTGQTDANGSMTRYWTLEVDNTYCGSISASTGSAQATASFWVAPTSDSRSGTPCDGGGAAASPTPDTTATAAAQATDAATQAPTQAPITQPTAAPATSGSGSGQGLLGGRVLLLIAGIAVALVILIVVGIALAAVLRKPDQRKGGWSASPSGRQPAQGWRQVPPGGQYGQQYGQSYSPRGAPRHEPQGWPQQAPRTPNRIPNHVQGAGQPDPRWRLSGDQGRDEDGTPDPRWSRSQPGARGGRGPAGSNSGSNSAGRIRTLRDFTEQHQSVRPPGRDDRGR